VEDHVAKDRKNEHQDRPATEQARRVWRRPSLTAYGPIGKLTQGGTGAKDDGSSTKKSICL